MRASPARHCCEPLDSARKSEGCRVAIYRPARQRSELAFAAKHSHPRLSSQTNLSIRAVGQLTDLGPCHRRETIPIAATREPTVVCQPVTPSICLFRLAGCRDHLHLGYARFCLRSAAVPYGSDMAPPETEGIVCQESGCSQASRRAARSLSGSLRDKPERRSTADAHASWQSTPKDPSRIPPGRWETFPSRFIFRGTSIPHWFEPALAPKATLAVVRCDPDAHRLRRGNQGAATPDVVVLGHLPNRTRARGHTIPFLTEVTGNITLEC